MKPAASRFKVSGKLQTARVSLNLLAAVGAEHFRYACVRRTDLRVPAIDMSKKSNEERAKWRARCRQKLAEHIGMRRSPTARDVR
jgi:hypothetical protein